MMEKDVALVLIRTLEDGLAVQNMWNVLKTPQISFVKPERYPTWLYLLH